MSVAVLPFGTKAAVPKLPDPWLRRDRLNEICAQLGPREVLLVAAFAGAGKTMLLADWYTNDCTTTRAWLTLDARDNAPGRLSALLARCLGVEDALDGLDSRKSSETLVLDRIFEALETRGEPTVLVLDDVHELTSRNAIRTLSHLVMRQPSTLAIVLATRADPPIPLGRLHLDGRMRQLRTRDLATTADETVALFDLFGVELETDAFESLRVRTGGWIGGLRLAAHALSTEAGDAGRFVQDVVRSDAMVSDYLVREVMDRLDPPLQRFLLRTSVAQRLTVDLARYLSGDDDAESRLEELERSGVFAIHMGTGPTTYEFHTLFGGLLRARLRHDDPEQARTLSDRAARWYVTHNMPIEAEAHAYEADNLKLAGMLTRQRWIREVLNGSWSVPLTLHVPSTAWSTDPSLALIAAVNAVITGDARSAAMWRTRLDALCAATTDDDDEESLHAGRLLLDVFYARAFGIDVRGRAACRALLTTELGQDSALLHAVVRLREAEILLDCDDEDATLRALLDARWRATRSAAPWIVDECDILLSLIAAVRGRLDACETLLHGIPQRADYDPTSDSRRLATALCEAQRGRHNTARAALMSASFSVADAHAVRAGAEEAIRRIDSRSDVSTAIKPSGEHPFAIQVRIALGALDPAIGSKAETALANARVLLARQRPSQVLDVLTPLCCERDMHTHLRTRIEALTLLAIAADELGDHKVALSSLEHALDLAAPADLRAPFLAYAALFGPMIDRYSWQLNRGGRYAADLVDELHPEEPPVFVEPLTDRERAVLEYLPTMMSNNEIAQQLLVSVNTVKTHLKSVYRKLGVERRRDAVVRARHLEIL
jgi:LuxR family maltose regulon positive regulatory protein